MGGLVDDLLLLARLDQGRPARAGAGRPATGLPPTRWTTPGPPTPDARSSWWPPDRSSVVGDRDRLAQVAHNLVRNALAHTPPGTPVRVVVTAETGWG